VENVELTEGQKLCGVDFNPTQDPLIAKVKQSYADIADILVEEAYNAITAGQANMLNDALSHLMTAQMWSIKAITWKH